MFCGEMYRNVAENNPGADIATGKLIKTQEQREKVL